MRSPFRGSNPFGAWQILIANNMLNLALLMGALVMVMLVFGKDDIAGKYIVLPVSYISGAGTFLLPLALILLIVRGTRKVGGVLLYLIASLWLIGLWLFALLSLYQNTGKWFTLLGVIVSLFSSGFGLFAAFALACVMTKQWTALLTVVGGVVLARVASNAGKSFMGLKTSQKRRRWKQRPWAGVKVRKSTC